MTNEELRLECLRLVLANPSLVGDEAHFVKTAEALERFVFGEAGFGQAENGTVTTDALSANRNDPDGQTKQPHQ